MQIQNSGYVTGIITQGVTKDNADTAKLITAASLFDTIANLSKTPQAYGWSEYIKSSSYDSVNNAGNYFIPFISFVTSDSTDSSISSEDTSLIGKSRIRYSDKIKVNPTYAIP